MNRKIVIKACEDCPYCFLWPNDEARCGEMGEEVIVSERRTIPDFCPLPGEEMKETTKSFYRGVMAALAVVAVYDQETIYRNIVLSVGKRELLAVLEEPEDAEWSGLKKYGYVNN